MTNSASAHRNKINQVLNLQTFEHQRSAANKAFDALSKTSRAVVIAAEMQSGKSGIALALACMQRNSLDDDAICERGQLKDTLYLVTMSDIALQDQAKTDLAHCPNVVVSNFSNFKKALNIDFKRQPPKLIIIDECHYGSTTEAIRYSRIFDYLESDNTGCKVAFISATPFGALYAAGSDSILRHNFHTKLVFHKTSDEYHGIRQMHRNQQIIKLDSEQRDFCDDSIMRRRFINQFKEHTSSGWSLVRVPNNSAQKAKKILIKQGIKEEQIYILGQKLIDVADEDLTSFDDFKREFETAQLFDEKIIAITVAGFRAGINFGQVMKETLIATWDSTIANIAAVVQANIGRACGYHNNLHAKHYTNLDAIGAYSALLDYLENDIGSKGNADETNFEGLHQLFEDICEKYEVNGFDRGTLVAPEKEIQISRKKDDSKTYMTSTYLAVPAKLEEEDPDFTLFTQNEDFLNAIKLIRNELLKEGGPIRKTGRALRGDHQNWIKAQWVNGVTYDDFSQSCAKQKTLQFIQSINNNEAIEFNTIVNPGGGERTEDKTVMASIFSVHNLSKQTDAYKRAMDEDDVFEMCDLLKVEYDSSLIVLFHRGSFSQDLTDTKPKFDPDIKQSRIRDHSIFR